MATSTTTMTLHLANVHDLHLDKYSARKQTILSFGSSKPSKTKPQQEVNQDFVIWLALDLQPFSFVADDGLKYFCGKYLQDINLPSSATLQTTALLDVYQDLRAKLISELKSISTICVMLDGWSDSYKARSYIGLRISYITNNWEPRLATLSCKVLPLHTAEAIANHVRSELEMFFPGRSRDLTIFSTHDGASNVKKASDLLRVEQYHHCVAHCLHLLLTTDSLNKVDTIKDVLLRCKEIVTTLQFKGHIIADEVASTADRKVMDNLLQKIEMVQNEQSLDEAFTVESLENEIEADVQSGHKTLKSSIVTRWNSCLTMISRILDLFTETNEALKRLGHRDLMLTASEKELLLELREFLTPFQEFTELVSGCQPNLSLTILIKEEIKKNVTKINRNEYPAIRQAKELVASKLETRLPITEAVQVVALLDPAMKDFVNMSTETKFELLEGKIQAVDEMPDLTENPMEGKSSNMASPESTAISKRQKLLDRFRASVDSSVMITSCQKTEVHQYVAAPPPPVPHENPITFWKENCKVYPNLANIARRYLCVNPSSVPVENMFSSCGLILNGKRSSIAPCRVNYLSFIHDNFRLFHKMN